jgi:hypothetical protein
MPAMAPKNFEEIAIKWMQQSFMKKGFTTLLIIRRLHSVIEV